MASISRSFNICFDPLAIYVGGKVCSIYNKAKPRFTAMVFRADEQKDLKINYDGLKYPFIYVRGDNQQQIYVLIIEDIIDQATTSKLLDRLQRAATWYVACLNKRDEKIYGKSSWITPDDYHSSMPGIQVLKMQKSSALLLFYTSGIRTFNKEDEVIKFLVEKLNYPNQGRLEVKITVHQ